MKKTLLSLALVVVALVFCLSAHADQSASCPNMNGHFVHSQFLASADAYITQVGCESVQVQVSAHILGSTTNVSYESQLDGVTRDVPQGLTANEKDTVSAQFVGDTAVIHADRYMTNSNGSVTHTANIIEAKMLSQDEIEVSLSGANSQGQPVNTKSYNFNRQD